MYFYAGTVQSSTSVKSGIQCSFTRSQPPQNTASPTNDQNLILNKTQNIQIYRITNSTLQEVNEIKFYTPIKIILDIYIESSGRSVLFVLLESLYGILIGMDGEKVVTLGKVSLEDDIGVEVAKTKGFVDPHNRYIALMLYEGTVKIILLQPTMKKKLPGMTLGNVFTLRLTESHIYSIIPIETGKAGTPTLGLLLNTEGIPGVKESREIFKISEILLEEQELKDVEYQRRVECEPKSYLCIPSTNSVLVLSPCNIRKYTYGGKGCQTLELTNISIFLEYSRIDCRRVVMGNNLCELYMLIENEDELKMEYLGSISYPSCIEYLDNGVTYIGSLSGPHMLIKLEEENTGEKGSPYIRCITKYENIAPIVHFQTVDVGAAMGMHGQSQIVACSGFGKQSELKLIAKGISLNVLAELDLLNTSHLCQFSMHNYMYILCRSINRTRVFRVDNNLELEEMQIGHLNEQKTEEIYKVSERELVQVTTEGVYMLSIPRAGDFLCPSAPEKIYEGGAIVSTCFQEHPALLCIGVEGGHIYIYHDIFSHLHTHLQVENEISSMGSYLGEYLGVSTWDLYLHIYSISGGVLLFKTLLDGDAVARCIQFACMEGVHYLLCGMADGFLITYTLTFPQTHIPNQQTKLEEIKMEDQPNPINLTTKRILTLGTYAVNLHVFIFNRSTHIFATGDCPTIIYSQYSKMQFVNVQSGPITDVSICTHPHINEALTILTKDKLVIADITDIHKIFIDSLPLGMQARFLGYSSEWNALIVLSDTSYAPNMHKDTYSFISVFDKSTFLKEDEIILGGEGTAKEEASSLDIIPRNTPPSNIKETIVIVGTVLVKADEKIPSGGRVLMYSLSNMKLEELASHKMNGGGVYSIKILKGVIISLSHEKLEILKIRTDKGKAVKRYFLETLIEHTSFVLANYLDVCGNYFLVGDLIGGVSSYILHTPDTESTIDDHEERKEEKSNKYRIEECSKFNRNCWTTSAIMIKESHILAADDQKDILSLTYYSKPKADIKPDELKYEMEMEDVLHIGETVNTFQNGSLIMNDIIDKYAQVSSTKTNLEGELMGNKMLNIIPKDNIKTILYATASGSIGVIAPLPQTTFKYLNALQNSMADRVIGLGDLTYHQNKRNSKNIKKLTKIKEVFLDGDFIQNFMSLDEQTMIEILEHMNYPHPANLKETITLLNQLAKIH